jgi:hypothetical protein
LRVLCGSESAQEVIGEGSGKGRSVSAKTSKRRSVRRSWRAIGHCENAQEAISEAVLRGDRDAQEAIGEAVLEGDRCVLQLTRHWSRLTQQSSLPIFDL